MAKLITFENLAQTVAKLKIYINTATAAASAKLKTARAIGLSGVTNTAQKFDGSADITIPITAVPASLITGTLSNNTTGNAATATNATNAANATYATNAGDASTVNSKIPLYIDGSNTMTGPLKLANNTLNLIGDDAYLGDVNISGCLGIKGANTTTGIALVQYGSTSYVGIRYDGTYLYFQNNIAGIVLPSGVILK